MSLIAGLPMYDWPETRALTDRFWSVLASGLQSAGLDAPSSLTRQSDLMALWQSPDLLLAQTCSLPWRNHLQAVTSIVGAFDYDLEGCPRGFYRSGLVVRADDQRSALAEFSGSALALNSHSSQSGYAALNGFGFASQLVTGSHRDSIQAVAQGLADLAAIDAVSLRLAEAFEPEMGKLRVLGWTKPTPGLPLITKKGQSIGKIREVMAAVSEDFSAKALGIAGFCDFDDGHYRQPWALVADRSPDA